VKEAFVDLGETTLKNIARPVRIYALKSSAATPAIAAKAEKPEPPRLSIVVLSFANLGGDASQEYFVDGVTESLTTDLSRISGAFVIGRSTAFTYKGNFDCLDTAGRSAARVSRHPISPRARCACHPARFCYLVAKQRPRFSGDLLQRFAHGSPLG
jgi:hypothetical protein